MVEPVPHQVARQSHPISSQAARFRFDSKFKVQWQTYLRASYYPETL